MQNGCLRRTYPRAPRASRYLCAAVDCMRVAGQGCSSTLATRARAHIQRRLYEMQLSCEVTPSTILLKVSKRAVRRDMSYITWTNKQIVVKSHSVERNSRSHPTNEPSGLESPSIFADPAVRYKNGTRLPPCLLHPK
jgi:hypothetical protein